MIVLSSGCGEGKAVKVKQRKADVDLFGSLKTRRLVEWPNQVLHSLDVPPEQLGKRQAHTSNVQEGPSIVKLFCHGA